MGELLKTGVSLAAVLFAIGYMIVNGRLSRYGLSDSAPLSGHYVAAGILFAGLVAGALLGKTAIVHEWFGDPSKSWDRIRAWPRLFRVVTATIGVLIAVSGIEWVGYLIVRLPAVADPAEAVTFIAWNAIAIAALLPLPWLWEQWVPTWTTGQGPQYVWRVVGAVPMALAAVILYSEVIFAQVPVWIGGGLAEDVILVPEKIEDFAQICPECAAAGGHAQLIGRDDHRLIVAVDSKGLRHAVEIAPNAVRSIIHQRFAP